MAGACPLFGILILFLAVFPQSFGRIHDIELKDDYRSSVKISTFGILDKGNISINLENLTFSKDTEIGKLGFSIQKTTSAGMSSYMENHEVDCLLKFNDSESNLSLVLFIFDWNKENKTILVRKCGKIQPSINNLKLTTNGSACSSLDSIPLNVLDLGPGKLSIYGSIVLYVKDRREQGLYTTVFHHCPGKTKTKVDLMLHVEEVNDGSYLSAGDAPLPMVFGFFSVVFFILSCIWFYVLRQYWADTFKVHYLMFLLVLLKALDVSLNAINYYYIGKDGTKAESWAVLHYIAHLLKGGLLFTTIILLGTGYFFIKHVLSGRDKKIFLIVIPLQIFDNIALIIMESEEEAQADYETWKQIILLVDLVCCGAVLFPVIWAIRHLKEASATDGKAAVNLAKLQLFRQFYIMIVCYIYFTRIIVAIVKITVPFQYQWLDELFMNLATLILFIMTGYKFRPGSDNPYLHVPQEDEDVEMDEVVTQTGLTENTTRVSGNTSNGTTTSRTKISTA